MGGDHDELMAEYERAKGETGYCAFCEMSMKDCLARAPAWCCWNCYHPLLINVPL